MDWSCDLAANPGARRLRWLGHVLRMEESRWIRRACTATQMHEYGESMFMDAPAHTGVPDLIEKAAGQGTWRAAVDMVENKKDTDGAGGEKKKD